MSKTLTLGEKVFNFVTALHAAGGKSTGWDYTDPITGGIARMYAAGPWQVTRKVFGEDANLPWFESFVSVEKGQDGQTVFTLTETGLSWMRAQMVLIQTAAVVGLEDER